MSFGGRERHSDCVASGEHEGKMAAVQSQLDAASATITRLEAERDRLKGALEAIVAHASPMPGAKHSKVCVCGYCVIKEVARAALVTPGEPR